MFCMRRLFYNGDIILATLQVQTGYNLLVPSKNRGRLRYGHNLFCEGWNSNSSSVPVMDNTVALKECCLYP